MIDKAYLDKITSIINSDMQESDKVTKIKGMLDPKDPEGGDEIMDKDMTKSKIKFNNASDYPKTYYFRHMEKGLAKYDAQNIIVLVEDEALSNMMPTLTNKPLYIMHKDKKDDKPENLEKSMHGVVSESFYNSLDGWYWAKVVVLTDEAKNKIESGWLVSNSYSNCKLNAAPSKYHNINYDASILSGEYDHLALVPTPRYEGVMILNPGEYKEYNDKLTNRFKQYQNSKKKGKIMGFKFWKKQEVDGAEELSNSFVEIGGKDVSFDDLVDNFKNEQEEEKKEKFDNMEKEVEVDGKKVSMEQLINCYKSSMSKKIESAQNAAEEAEDEKKKKEAEEGNKHFDNLQNAIDKGADNPGSVAYDSVEDKLKRGSEY